MFRAGDPRPQLHDMKANRTESNEGPRAKSDCPRSRSCHHSERLGVSELLHVLVAFAFAFACSPDHYYGNNGVVSASTCLA